MIMFHFRQFLTEHHTKTVIQTVFGAMDSVKKWPSVYQAREKVRKIMIIGVCRIALVLREFL